MKYKNVGKENLVWLHFPPFLLLICFRYNIDAINIVRSKKKLKLG